MGEQTAQQQTEVDGIAYSSGNITTIILLTAIVLTAVFMLAFCNVFINIAMVIIYSDFHVDIGTSGWMNTGYSLAIIGLSLVFGKVSEFTGKKKLLIVGLIIFAAGSLACGLAGGFNQLIAFRVVQGVGASMMIGIATAMLFDAFPPRWRGLAMGLIIATTEVSNLLSPLIIGTSISDNSWRPIFFILVPIGVLLAIALVFTKFPDVKPAHAGLFDASTPGNRKFLLQIVSLMIFNMSTLALNLIGVYYFYNSYYSLAQIGLWFTMESLVMIPLVLGSGLIYSIFPWKFLPVFGAFIAALGLAIFGISLLMSSPGLILISIMLVGSGEGIFISPNNTGIMSALSPDKTGIAAGAMYAAMYLSSMILTALMNAVPNLQTGTVSGIMIVAGAACLVAAAASALGNVRS